jgi:hypothetical protein
VKVPPVSHANRIFRPSARSFVCDYTGSKERAEHHGTLQQRKRRVQYPVKTPFFKASYRIQVPIIPGGIGLDARPWASVITKLAPIPAVNSPD